METQRFSLKDQLFNETKVRYLAGLLAESNPLFLPKEFQSEVMSRLLQLELKDRIRWIAEVLSRHLDANPARAIAQIVAALPLPLTPYKTDDDFGDFIFAPFGEYVAQYGAQKEFVHIALPALREITMRFSMEDAMRMFLARFPQETLDAYLVWAHDPHYHVRRLVSESTRPFLPWSTRVLIPWEVRRELLTTLHADSARFVTRSVANHLNDEAKINPDGVLALLAQWQDAGVQKTTELAWMQKHALRTLIKRGHAGAFAQQGFADDAAKVTEFTVASATTRGSKMAMSITIEALVDSKLVVDYVLGFVKANGGLKEKVFKWKTFGAKAGESYQLHKSHHFKSDATTFTLYPGVHTVTVQINGVRLNTDEVTLQ